MGNETKKYRLKSIYAATDPNQGGHALTQLRIGQNVVAIGDTVDLTDDEFLKLSRYGELEELNKKEAKAEEQKSSGVGPTHNTPKETK